MDLEGRVGKFFLHPHLSSRMCPVNKQCNKDRKELKLELCWSSDISDDIKPTNWHL